MNHRVVVVVLLSLWTTCFVGTGAIGTLTVIKSIVNGSKKSRPDPYANIPAKDPDPYEPSESSQPPEPEPDAVAAVKPKTIEPEEELQPPDEEDTEAADYQAPLLGSGEFAVFHQEKAKLDPWAALQKAVKGTRLKAFKGEAPISASPPYAELRDLSVEDYAVIAGATLENGRGLSAAVKKALPKAKRVSVVDVVLPLGVTHLLDVSKAMHSFALLTGGVLWDEEAQEYLSIEAWKTRRIDSWEKTVPQVPMNITVFVTTLEDTVDLHSAGLKHFGLPELELSSVPLDEKDVGVALLNATAQVIAESKTAVGPGPLDVTLADLKHVKQRKAFEEKVFENADRTVQVTLAPGKNVKVPTLSITFPGAGTADERVLAGLDELFGFEE